jgi:hypothetical protein
MLRAKHPRFVLKPSRASLCCFALVSLVAAGCSTNNAEEETYCEEGLGTTSCFTARADGRGNFQVVMKWEYDEPRDIGTDRFASTAEWGANIICELSDGSINYITMKDSQGESIPLEVDTRDRIRTGLFENALPKIVNTLCE